MTLQNIGNNSEVKKAIVEAIAFFDIFDYPLTAFEVWKYFKIKCELSNVVQILEGEILDVIEEKNGFYFLKGRQKIIETRLKRYNYTNRKLKKAIFIAKIFKLIPWIKMIAVGNILGSHNLRNESDIDLFIVTDKNKIWITRFFCVLITIFLGQRPKPKKMCDKICLSFFVDEEAVNLKGLTIDNDIYFVYWLAGLMPVYDTGRIYKKFVQANLWVKEFLPNWEKKEISFRCNAGKSFLGFYSGLIDWFFGRFEKNVKKIQMNKMPKELKSLIGSGKKVVVNDNVLKLHANDRRKKYYDIYIKKLKEIQAHDF